MSQQQVQKTKNWVIITVLKEDAPIDDPQRISSLIQDLIDTWQSQGKILWSGTFDDNVTSMTVFEGTEQEANEFYQKYDMICTGILEYSIYEWNAMPILSFLSG